jgi:hypothetical protein
VSPATSGSDIALPHTCLCIQGQGQGNEDEDADAVAPLSGVVACCTEFGLALAGVLTGLDWIGCASHGRSHVQDVSGRFDEYGVACATTRHLQIATIYSILNRITPNMKRRKTERCEHRIEDFKVV